MKKILNNSIITFLFFTSLSFLYAEQQERRPSTAINKSSTASQPPDATEEINAMENIVLPINNRENAQEIQVFLNHFAGVVGNFLNIIQDSDNPTVVDHSIANMISDIINITVEIIKNDKLSPQASQKEITRYVEKLLTDEQFKKRFIKLITAKRDCYNQKSSL